MSALEGHDCWEDCDEGPHGCVCGNGCEPEPARGTVRDDLEALRLAWLRLVVVVAYRPARRALRALASRMRP